MKFVTWIEAILIVTLLAMVVSTAALVRKLMENARASGKPEEPAIAAKWKVPELEQTAARARDETGRIYAKLVDARAAVLQRQADLAPSDAQRRLETLLTIYFHQSEQSQREQEMKLAAARRTASKAFRTATEDYDRDTQLIAAAISAGVTLVLYALAWICISRPPVRASLQIDRRVVFVTTLVLLPFTLLEVIVGAAAVVLAAAVAIIVVIFFIAAATPPVERRGA